MSYHAFMVTEKKCEMVGASNWFDMETFLDALEIDYCTPEFGGEYIEIEVKSLLAKTEGINDKTDEKINQVVLHYNENKIENYTETDAAQIFSIMQTLRKETQTPYAKRNGYILLEFY